MFKVLKEKMTLMSEDTGNKNKCNYKIKNQIKVIKQNNN